MFFIIGGDGKEYGPVTADQLHAWLAAGRASLDTRARRDGTEEWRRVADFTEFAPLAAAAQTSPAFTTTSGPVAIVTDPTLAERGTRLGAAAIDYVVPLVCSLPGLVILGLSLVDLAVQASEGQEVNWDAVNAGQLLLGGILLGAAGLAVMIVQVVMLSTRGQTIGKRLVGIRVVRYPDGAKAGFIHGWLLRSLVPGVIGLIPYLGAIFMLVDICFIFGDERRCLHDLMAGTKVVKK